MQSPERVPRGQTAGATTDDSDASVPQSSTQQPTQSTQHGSPPDAPVDPNAWGHLVPYDVENMETITFERWKRRYQIGRVARIEQDPQNDIVLNGKMISGKHCIIEWDGVNGAVPSIRVTDLNSSNGTYINQQPIGKGKSVALRDGNDFALGTWLPQETEDGKLRAFRYIYRHAAYSPPTQGLYQHYDIVDELGRGSYATVMKALHKEEGTWYAIKIIDPNKLRTNWTGQYSGSTRLDEITREIKILQRLRHPNVCQMKEHFVDGCHLSVVLEWVPGGDLLHYLFKHHGQQNMSERQAQYFTYQICDALSYVHREGIAHRDLKPENVLLTSDDPPIVKVADFGLAKALDGETLLRTLCGTPAYLAPEVVIQGEKGYSLLVDSWSVGVIVFSMLTMKMPFLEDTEGTIAERVATRKVMWETLYECDISPEGEEFLRSLLQNDPCERMNMADACAHRWLTEQAMTRMKTRPSPFSAASLSATSTVVGPGPSSVVFKDSSLYEPRETPASQRTARPSAPPRAGFAEIDLDGSVPGLQTCADPLPAPELGPQDALERRKVEPDGHSEQAAPARQTKRTASLAFSSSEDSFAELYRSEPAIKSLDAGRPRAGPGEHHTDKRRRVQEESVSERVPDGDSGS